MLESAIRMGVPTGILGFNVVMVFAENSPIFFRGIRCCFRPFFSYVMYCLTENACMVAPYICYLYYGL